MWENKYQYIRYMKNYEDMTTLWLSLFGSVLTVFAARSLVKHRPTEIWVADRPVERAFKIPQTCMKHPWNIHETVVCPVCPVCPPNSTGSKFTTQLPRTCHESRGTSRTPKDGIIVLNGTWTPRDRPVELQDLRLRAIVRWINILSGLAVGSTPCWTVAQLDKQMKLKG